MSLQFGSIRFKRTLASAALAIITSANFAHSATTTWTNSTGNSLWSDAANWSAGVPMANVDAEFGLLGNHTINLGGTTRAAANIAKVNFDNSFRFINGQLDITGTTTQNAFEGFIFDCDLTSSRPTLTLGGQTTVNGRVRGSGFTFVTAGVTSLNGTNTLTGETILNGDVFLSGSIRQSSLIRLRSTLNTSSNSLGATARVRMEGGNWSQAAATDIDMLEFGERSSQVSPSIWASNISTITVNNMTRQVGATARFRIAQTTSTVVGLRVTTTLPQMFGDGASPERLPILPWATTQFGPSASFPDASFATYDRGVSPGDPNDDVGFRALRESSGEFATTLVNGANVKLVTSTVATGASSPNSLTLKGATLTLGNSGDLALGSGGLMMLPGGSAGASIVSPVGSTAAVTAAGEMVLFAFNNNGSESLLAGPRYYVDAPLRANSLTVSGGAALELFRANTFPGGAHVIETGIVLHDISALGTSTIHLSGRFAGARLTIPDSDQVLPNDLVLRAGPSSWFSLPAVGVTRLTGQLAGDGAFTIGGGNLLLAGQDNGTDSYRLRIANGNYIIDGAYTSRNASMTVYGNPHPGFFGNGSFLGYFEPTGGTISPGEINAIGRLTLGKTFWSSATLLEQISGTSPASGYDQIVMLDALALDTADGKFSTLNLQLVGGFIPSVGDSFLIFDNRFAGAVSGYFSGLPEGAIFAAGGARFQISYLGGDGNDVTLTVVPEPTLLSLSTFLVLVASSRRPMWRNRRR